MSYTPPTKTEKEMRNKHALFVFAISVMVFIILALVVWFAKYFFTVASSGMNFNEWNGSAGSFWGAILGAFAAGIVTIIANYMVIHRSYRMDYHRERLEVMPIFELEPVSINRTFEEVAEDIQQGKAPIPRSVLNVFWGEVSPDQIVNVCLLKNIGKGIAYKVSTSGLWPDYCDEPYRSLVAPGKGVWVVLPLEDGEELIEKYVFDTIFQDLYGNTYKQEFRVRVNPLNMVQTLTNPPELVHKTQRIRYEQ